MKADPDGWSFLWLLLGTVFLIASNGNWSIPVAAWISPFLWIRFFRGQKGVLGILVGALFLVAAYNVIYWHILSIDALSPAFRTGSGTAVGLLFFLPFLADRLLAPRLSGIPATLVFPFAWVTVEYLISRMGGSWGALAYTQYGNLPFMQLVSLTGIWGISFLITWFASAGNAVWENRFDRFGVRRLVWVCPVVLLFALLYGGARVGLFPSGSETVKVASVLNPNVSFVSRFFGPDFKDRESIARQTATEQDELLDRSREAAHGGAEIVVWQEYATTVLKENEAFFIKQGSELARHEGIYLVMVYAVLPQDFPDKPWENKLVWIDPEGKIVREYLKSKPAAPLEPIPAGDGNVPVVNTPFGKIASVICADLDYPSLVRQVGKAGAGLLLIPSLDWKSVSPLHSHMAVFRAIENGCAMVKPTGEGLSVAVDHRGRVLASLDYWETAEKVMMSHVSTMRAPTVYSKVGDLWAWISMGGLVVLIPFAILGRKPRQVRKDMESPNTDQR